MSVYRSALLRFADDGRALYDEDGLLAIGHDAQGRQRVLAAGSWQALGDAQILQMNWLVEGVVGKLAR